MKKLLLTVFATIVLLALFVVPAFAAEADPVTITFDPDGGTLDDSLKTMQIVPGETYENLPVPVMEKYDFVCWNIYSEHFDEELQIMVPEYEPVNEGDICTLTGDATLVAEWEQSEFTLNFYVFLNRSEVDLSNPAYQMTFKKDEPTRLPTDEEFTVTLPEGYVFDGWFSDMGLASEFEFGETLDEDDVVYAGVFKEDELIRELYFNIAFPRVGAEVTVDHSGEEMTQTGLPEIKVYTDAGVETSLTCGYLNYTEDDILNAGSVEEIIHMASNMVFSGTFEEGEEYILGVRLSTLVTDEKGEEKIAGYLSENSNLVVWVNGESVEYSIGEENERTSRTFYFRFTPVTCHTISFVTGTDEVIDPIIFYEDEVIPDVVPETDKEGCEFFSWIRDPEKKNSFFNRLNPPKEDITVYALWARTIDTVGFTISSLPKIGDEVTVTDDYPDVIPDASLIAYCGDEPVDEINLRYGVFYSVLGIDEEEPYEYFEGTFEENGQYFIHFYAHTFPSFYSEDEDLYFFADDSDSSYYVNGWRTANYYVNEVNVGYFLDFYYEFKPVVDHTVTITFDADGGELDGPSTMEVTPGQVYGDLPKPVRDGYEFSRWYSNDRVYDETEDEYYNTKSFRYYSDDVCTLTEDKTLIAEWTQTRFYLDFYAFDGIDDALDEYGSLKLDDYIYRMPVEKGEVTRLPSSDELELIIPEGYEFKGWYTSPLYSEEYRFGEELTSDDAVFACILKSDKIIHSVDFSFDLPRVGDSIGIETVLEEYLPGFPFYHDEQTNLPEVSLTNDAGVRIDITETAYLNGLYANYGGDREELFEGTFEEGKEYTLFVGLTTFDYEFLDEGIKFNVSGYFADDFKITLNGRECEYVIGDDSTMELVEVYFKFTPVPESKVEVDATESGLVVSVSEEEQEKLLADVARQFDQTDADYGIDVVITVSDHEATAEEKAAFEKAAGDREVALYLDVDITAILDGKEYAVTELGDKIAITVALPETLQGKDYKYVVIRDHEGKLEVLPATLSEDGKSITFMSDKFSTYAIAYTAPVSETETVARTDAPAADSSEDMILAVFPMLLATAAAVILSAKKSRKEQI